jgi:hypothetical protein
MSDSNPNPNPNSNSITVNDFMAAIVTWGGAMASAMTEDTTRHMQALKKLPGTPTEFHPL